MNIFVSDYIMALISQITSLRCWKKITLSFGVDSSMRIKYRHGLFLLAFIALSVILYNSPLEKRRRSYNERLLPAATHHLANLYATASRIKSCVVIKKEVIQKTTPVAWFRNAMIIQNNTTVTARPTDDRSQKNWKFQYGFIKVICPVFSFSKQFASKVKKIHKNLLTNVPLVYTNMSLVSVDTRKLWTTLDSVVFLIREEYANPYWVLIDLIDIYVALNQSKVDPSKTTIIWGDNHTDSVADQLWDTVFKNHIQVSPQPEEQHRFIFANNLLLRPDRSLSIALQRSFSNLSILYEFRQVVYHNLGLVPNQFSCDAIRVLVVWRRDYVNHPGNPNGKIDRKVENEKEVIATMRSLNYALVNEVQLDKLSAVDQIRLMSETDVFWGVHGAGHAMSIFLPSGRVVVELVPNNKVSNWHMSHLSKLSGHKHITAAVQKSFPEKDNTYYTVTPETVRNTLQQARDYLCI